MAEEGDADISSIRYAAGNKSHDIKNHMAMEAQHNNETMSPNQHVVRKSITDNTIKKIEAKVKQNTNQSLVHGVMYFVEVLFKHGSMDLATLSSNISHAPEEIKTIVKNNSKKVSKFIKAQTCIFNIDTTTNIVTFPEELYEESHTERDFQKANILLIAHSNVAERDALLYFMTLVNEQGSLKMRQLHGYISQATKTVQDFIGSKPENVIAFIMKHHAIFYTDTDENVCIQSTDTSYLTSSKTDTKPAPKPDNDNLICKGALVNSVGIISEVNSNVGLISLLGNIEEKIFFSKKDFSSQKHNNDVLCVGTRVCFNAKRDSNGNGTFKWKATKVWMPELAIGLSSGGISHDSFKNTKLDATTSSTTEATTDNRNGVKEKVPDKDLDIIKSVIKQRVDQSLFEAIMYFVEVLLEHGTMDLAQLSSSFSQAPDEIKCVVKNISQKVSLFIKAQASIFNIDPLTNVVTLIINGEVGDDVANTRGNTAVTFVKETHQHDGMLSTKPLSPHLQQASDKIINVTGDMKTFVENRHELLQLQPRGKARGDEPDTDYMRISDSIVCNREYDDTDCKDVLDLRENAPRKITCTGMCQYESNQTKCMCQKERLDSIPFCGYIEKVNSNVGLSIMSQRMESWYSLM